MEICTMPFHADKYEEVEYYHSTIVQQLRTNVSEHPKDKDKKYVLPHICI